MENTNEKKSESINNDQEIEKALTEHVEKSYPEKIGTWVRALPFEGVLSHIDYFKGKEGVPHWYFVTYGFVEELHCNFELTFRLKREESEVDPPQWVNRLLQKMANFVRESGEGFSDCDYADLQGPLDADMKTDLVAVGFVIDPELGKTNISGEDIQFLQLFPIDADGLAAMQGDDYINYIEEMRKEDPLFIVDLEKHRID